MSPTVRLIWPEGLGPWADLARGDEDGNSHLSDIPLQFPASAKFASDNSALVTLSQAEGPLAECSKSPFDANSDRGVNRLQLQNPVTHFSKCTCNSWTSRNCSIGCTRSTRSSECSARNGSTCFASSTSRCHSSIRSGCEAKSCQCFGKT